LSSPSPPDPFQSLVAYRGPSLARAGAVGWLKSGPSPSPLGAQSEPGRDGLSGDRWTRFSKKRSGQSQTLCAVAPSRELNASRRHRLLRTVPGVCAGISPLGVADFCGSITASRRRGLLRQHHRPSLPRGLSVLASRRGEVKSLSSNYEGKGYRLQPSSQP
jgi:hypothetical protein